MRRLGEIFISLRLDNSKYLGDLEAAKQQTTRATEGMERQHRASDDRILASKKALNQQRLREEAALESAILKSQNSFNQQRLREEAATQDWIAKGRARLTTGSIQAIENEEKIVKTVVASRMTEYQKMYDSQIAAQNKANAALSQGRAGGDIKSLAEKMVGEDLAKADAQAQKFHAGLRAGLSSTEAWKNSMTGASHATQSFLEKTASTTKNVLAAAPGFAIATASIAAFYTAVRTLTGEFVNGLKAVEDYEVKVASMTGFMVTFNKSVTQANASEIYRASTTEARKLVDAMEVLDARTVATGKDLTTMAEQFIKGGVKIDVTNKGTLDGFANIANALKLMTQGQNQEIQMRQEIRALVMGQLRDTNLLAKTLESIDPNIKENIKLWKQQGTLIENVGKLLVGFGPAAKDLENTWSIVGTTMETIHNRILRSAFKDTYDSLISSAKSWNSALMDSNGQLTNFAKNIVSTLEFLLLFIRNIGHAVKNIGMLALAISPFAIAILAVKTNIDLLTVSMLKNPLTAGLVIATIALTAKTVYDLNKQHEEAANSAKKLGDEMDRISPPEKGEEALSYVKKLKVEFSQAAFEANKMRVLGLGGGAGREKSINVLKGDRLTPSSGLSFDLPSSHISLTKGEIEERLKSVRDYSNELKRQGDTYKMNATQLARYELETGKYAKALSELSAAGKFQEAQELKSKALREAQILVSKQLREESSKAWESVAKSAESTVTSLNSMNLTQEKSQEAIWKSKLASESYRKELGLTIAQFDRFKKSFGEQIISAARGADERKSAIERAKTVEELQEKLSKLKIDIFPAEEEGRPAQKLRNRLDEIVAEFKKAGAEIPPVVKQMYDELANQSNDWVRGAQDGLNNYIRSAKNAFGETGKIFEKVFKGMEDAMVEFIKNGKVSFSSLADSIINDLIRIAVQQSITVPLASGASGFLGGWNDASTSAGGLNMFLSNFLPFANGGAAKGGNISNLSNHIITQATPFTYGNVNKFADGAGVAGEAGWEAIMPLKRGADGKLGVSAASGGGVNVIINNNTNSQITTSEQQNQQGGKDIIVMIDEAVGGLINSGRGKTVRALRTTFGANPVLAGR